ncbi:hypothetical protein EYC84_005926 [Monilinia fructicola]|uniref:Uncharacterized protein n=1 Tax=Monilinia fructicola TaxID=38448 RepID=A0A5M9K6N6_MONFR|nr:hypothetical protein EYC84_005926 [Monilinia fructicola]
MGRGTEQKRSRSLRTLSYSHAYFPLLLPCLTPTPVSISTSTSSSTSTSTSTFHPPHPPLRPGSDFNTVDRLASVSASASASTFASNHKSQITNHKSKSQVTSPRSRSRSRIPRNHSFFPIHSYPSPNSPTLFSPIPIPIPIPFQFNPNPTHPISIQFLQKINSIKRKGKKKEENYYLGTIIIGELL